MGDSYFRDLEDENIDDPLDPGRNSSSFAVTFSLKGFISHIYNEILLKRGFLEIKPLMAF